MRKKLDIEGIFGNGRILGTVGGTGDITQIFWPNIDFPSHISRTKMGIVNEYSTSWLSSMGWKNEISYLPSSNVIQVVSRKKGIRVKRYIFALSEDDTTVIMVEVENKSPMSSNFKFEFYSDFNILESPRANAVYYDPASQAMVFYKRNYFFSVGANANVDTYSSLRADKHTELGLRMRAKATGESTHAIGDVAGYLCWNLGRLSTGDTGQASIFICCGNSSQEVLSKIEDKKKQDIQKVLEDTIEESTSFLSKTRIPGIEGDRRKLFERSVLAIRLLCDSKGGILNAPEFDPDFSFSGGYGYVNVRDGVYAAFALDCVGQHNLSRKFYEWLIKSLNSLGYLYQRYWTVPGLNGPNSGILQVDETAAFLWGLKEHIGFTEDNEFLNENWDKIKLTADHLSGLVNEDKLLAPCGDIWEERMGVHAYSTASVYAGLKTASEMALIKGDHDKKDVWGFASDRLREGFIEKFWDNNEETFARSLLTEELIKDCKPDASLLGISVPFQMIPPNNRKMLSTVAKIEEFLQSETGGILRFENDKYFGGNPWTLTTLWLAWYKLELGEKEEAEKLIDWCIRSKNSLDLLPEQLREKIWKKESAIPLTWSHALYIITALKLEEK
ncbi:MAG: glycoside hydrolase family 15 protein [Candidatus Lokiarchaeia archaeon]